MRDVETPELKLSYCSLITTLLTFLIPLPMRQTVFKK